MDILEGIKARKSIRAFRPDSVSESTIRQILEVSIRSPSGVNLQPWEFYVVRGKALEELKRANLEEYRKGTPPEPEMPVGNTKGVAPVLQGIFRKRQVDLAKEIFRIMGIPKGDKEKQEAWNEKMVQFYDAPAVIIICVDRSLEGEWPVLDVGLVTQTIALCALAHGLGTCIMRAIVDYPKRLREISGIPESKRIIVGIAIGYPDWNHPINSLKTERENIDKILTFVE